MPDPPAWDGHAFARRVLAGLRRLPRDRRFAVPFLAANRRAYCRRRLELLGERPANLFCFGFVCEFPSQPRNRKERRPSKCGPKCGCDPDLRRRIAAGLLACRELVRTTFVMRWI